MNKIRLFSLVGAAALLLSACGQAAPTVAPTAAPKPTEAPPAPKPTDAPKPTEAAKPTEAPKPTAAPAFAGQKLESTDCKAGEIKSIEAVDALTVRFSLCVPDPALPQKLTGSSFGILQKDDIKATGGVAKAISEKPVGTGPFKITEWKRGDSVTMAANPTWWGGALKIKTLVIRWSKEPAQALLELKSGNADAITKVATEDFENVKKDAKLKLVPLEPLNIMYVGINNTKAPFDNEKVRQALAMAIDRKKIVDEYYPAGSIVAENFVPPSFKPGFSANIKGWEYKPDEAKKMLTEAGFDFNKEYPLSYREVSRVYLGAPGKVGQEVQAQLKKIGIKIKLDPKESGTFLKSVADGGETLFLLGWGADYPDATNFYDTHFGVKKDFGKPWDDIIAQIKAGGQTADNAKRQAAYDKVNELVKQHVPVIPIAHGFSGEAFQAGVEGAHANPLVPNEYAVMKGAKDTFVSVQAAEPISLDCADETDGETFNVCGQMFESLLSFEPGTVKLKGVLATEWKANDAATEWTFKLRPNVKFHNGATMDANDVVATYARQWDASSPYHKGDSGNFDYWNDYFGGFLNKK